MTQRELIVSIAQSYIGCKESDGSHKAIIDIYNNHKPLAQGYKVQYTDAWCSTFASAVAIKANLTDIIPTECGCERHVNLFKSHSKSRWEEDGTYRPSPGDYCFYNWDDSTQPNDGAADHVGIVEKVSGSTITVIEGNYSDAVGRRSIKVGNGYIRGYGIPAYSEDEVDITTLTLSKGDGGAPVKELQTKLIALGYSCGSSGADGDFGSGTLAAVKKFQSDNGLTADGIVGSATWAALASPKKIEEVEEPEVKGTSKMKYSSSSKPLVCMMTNSTCYKQTKEMIIKGVLWHSTGANNATIKRYVQPSTSDSNYDSLIKTIGKNNNKNSWNEMELSVGVNAFIGQLADGSVASVQALPWNYKPWGCGSGSKGSCNNGFIQFECCEDDLSNETYFNKVYEEACQLTAYLCKMYNIDPKGTVTVNGVSVSTILCHADSYSLGLGSNHGDVYNWFNKYNKTMDNVREDVAAILSDTSSSTTTTTAAVAELYRVRSDWNNASTQKGAFTKLQSAINCCKSAGKGYYVFDNNGEVVYPEEEEVEETKTTFAVGDEVSLAAGATYTNGKEIPNWVFRTKLYVRQVLSSGNIIFSTLASGAVTGTVKPEYLVPYEGTTVEAEASEFEVGDNARLISGAKYINGNDIPDWIVKQVVYIREIRDNGDIVFSRLKTGNITGVVKPNQLVANTTKEAEALYRAKVIVPTLNVRENPGTSYPIVVQIKKGSEYNINEVSGRWGYVGELNGWVALQYTKKVKS